jgi:hypothetical protein
MGMTYALWSGFVPMALLGGLFSWWRTRYFTVTGACEAAA